ncbi:MAG: ABC transporter ATP-binding protein [Planctomycetota bacterium]|nr:ABC transporter ATP-binding protein [Planctomycetota bacterium]
MQAIEGHRGFPAWGSVVERNRIILLHAGIPPSALPLTWYRFLPMNSIKLSDIRKSYGSTVAVDGIDLVIEPGELFFLLGPSGCGKTTLLRMIAGFIEPTGGSIHFDDRNVTSTPPNKRNTGMVFQSYALWPHMTVAENVGYGLVLRKIPADQRATRVQRALEMVQMGDYAQRKPNELSGGQQQRVALARALVVEPGVLLLDEPLSNLDAKLRLEMRSEIRRICKEAGITTVYVTHDQDEALSMADRVAVLRHGKAVQVGDPRTLYRRPATRFVAEFLGETNFISAEVVGRTDAGVELQTPVGKMVASSDQGAVPERGSVTCSIRPEAFRVGGGDLNSFEGEVEHQVFLGDQAQYHVRIGDDMLVRALQLNPTGESQGRMRVSVDPDDIVILSD